MDKEYHNLVIPIYPMAINPRNINNKFTLLNNTILASIDVYVNMNDNLLTEPMKFLNRLKTLVKKSGYVILSTPFSWSKDYTPKVSIKLFKKIF